VPAATSVRHAALLALLNIKNGAYVNLELQSAMKRYGSWSQADKAFFTELLYGTMRRQLYIDHFIGRWSRISIARMDPVLLCAIRMGIYQIHFLNSVPAYAAIFDTCEALKRIKPQFVGFLNAVLRTASRETDWQINAPSDSTEYMAIEYSHPLWLVKRWVARFGTVKAKSVMQRNNEAPMVWLRYNSLRITKVNATGIMQRKGIPWQSVPEIDAAYGMVQTPVEAVRDEIALGLFSVQDIGSMLVSMLLNPQPGESILDLCAAPGSKSCHMAELMKNEGRVISVDLHAHRVELIRANAQRTGCSIVEPLCRDAAVPWDEGEVDAVLLDAPCSGTGVLRRKADARWSKSEQHLKDLQQLQRRLLKTAAGALRKGGRLIYSTCSLEPEENEDNIKWFLSEFRNFSLSEVPALPVSDIPGSLSGVTTMTSALGHGDGFFIAILSKSMVGV